MNLITRYGPSSEHVVTLEDRLLTGAASLSGRSLSDLE